MGGVKPEHFKGLDLREIALRLVSDNLSQRHSLIYEFGGDEGPGLEAANRGAEEMRAEINTRAE